MSQHSSNQQSQLQQEAEEEERYRHIGFFLSEQELDERAREFKQEVYEECKHRWPDTYPEK